MGLLLINLPAERVPAAHIERIKQLAPQYQIVQTTNISEMEPIIDQVEIIMGNVPQKILERASNLRWIHSWGAGVEWLSNNPNFVSMPFQLTNTSGIHAIQITEHIMAFLLSFARDFPMAIKAQQERTWKPSQRETVFELAGKTMVLVGVGAIGERTAAVASAMGMRVLGVRRNANKSTDHIEAMYSNADLLKVLPEADFVVVTAPLSNETKGMFGAAEFAAMKPSAYIVNIGRGPIIDQDAMISALQNGQIAGAGLDVFTPEPLPSDSPLWAMDNVIITAHYAGMTPHYDSRAFEIFAQNLPRYLAGETLTHLVDKEAGY
jgi:phosphoglycerate dehydrogenase-like enzyme